MAYAKHIKPYSNEVTFQVGERVQVEIDLIPKEERNVTTGIIVKINTKFMHTPNMRSIRCTMRMDGEYCKTPIYHGIGEIFGTDIKNIRRLD